MTFLLYDNIVDLFKEHFKILFIEEILKNTHTVQDGEQQWHQWNVIAVKKPISPSCLPAYHI